MTNVKGQLDEGKTSVKFYKRNLDVLHAVHLGSAARGEMRNLQHGCLHCWIDSKPVFPDMPLNLFGTISKLTTVSFIPQEKLLFCSLHLVRRT